MSSERLKTQIQFEDVLGESDYSVFESKTQGEIKAFSISAKQVELFKSALKDDAIDFYYKGLISLIEALISLNYKGFSWATVKIYYAIFYFLRSSLCLNNIGFGRKGRDLYYFSNEVEGKFIPWKHPDHKAAIELFIKLYDKTDYLQSNKINDINSYQWVMIQRENVNYKNRTFYEPDLSDIWISISSFIDSNGLEYWINNYLKEDVYTFQEDHAIMAMPLRLFLITHNKFSENPLRPEKQIRIKTLIKENNFLSFLEDYIKKNDL